jgi:cytochrome b pre-mRNA-processing protein 3
MILAKLQKLFARKADPAQRLYEAIVAAARQPPFFTDMKVPDTVDGRFEMIVLHLYLVLGRLKGGQHDAMRQALTDTFFKDMDRSLREMGTGDLSVGKKVRKMAEAFFGRIKAYEDAADETALVKAIARNVFAEISDKTAPELARVIGKRKNSLAAQSDNDVLSGKFGF